MSVYVGIDTSCYTTSVAAIDANGELVADLRKLLQVPSGERGLQQSAALFQHVQNLPTLLSELSCKIDMSQISGVAVSTRPRPLAGSYMPVFTVSAGQGQILASALGVPLINSSHQEGHLVAGLWSAGKAPKNDKFLAVHLSGGTTELLLVEKRPVSLDQPLFQITLLGGTTDLHAGQFIDRVGVRLGLGFPAGPHLEELAKNGCAGRGLIPSSVQGYDVSFSGPESHAQRLIDTQTPPELVARAVEACIVKTLIKLIAKGMAEEGISEVLVVGGVAANAYVRGELQSYFEKQGNNLFFAHPKFSSDNAVGTAVIARKAIKEKSSE
jgi:N6-L-threonylcarbamoyladenine synthase